MTWLNNRLVFHYLLEYFWQPVRLFRNYSLDNLRIDLVAGVTISIILLPQAIAYALIGEMPPSMGLFAAIVGAIVGALWGSSNQLHTGPTNAISLLVLSTIVAFYEPNTPEFLAAIGLLAVMVGVFQIVIGVARLGVLVNFVSDSVIVGFTAGAGILIGIGQLKHFLGVEFSARDLIPTLQGIAVNLPQTHWPTFLLGLASIAIILILRRVNRKLPTTLISLVAAALVVFLLNLNENGVAVIGELPRSLPPLADLPLFDLNLIARLSTGALATGAIGLIQTVAIARSMAAQTGQRLDSNQEFVGQGLANIACGFFSGYPASGSFGRSAVSLQAGARSPFAAVFSGIFVAIALLILAPLAAYIPRTALAGVLLIVAYELVDRKEMMSIWRGARGDALVMIVTMVGTLLLPIEFAVLAGIVMSLGYYILRTSTPHVHSVMPDSTFSHLVEQPDKGQCPQLGIMDIHGDLYFGAIENVEKAFFVHAAKNPRQRYLLLRMHGVNHCDFSGIRMLEHLTQTYRDKGGDIYMTRVRAPIKKVMCDTEFDRFLGEDHFLHIDNAIEYLFYNVLNPAICIYESNVRVFKECQNLPRPDYPVDITIDVSEAVLDNLPTITPQELWEALHNPSPPVVIDVREPREYNRDHVISAESVPLPKVLTESLPYKHDREIVLVCLSGRRSSRAAFKLRGDGFTNITILKGGTQAWRAANLLEAVAQNYGNPTTR